MSELVKELIPYLEKLTDKLGTTAQYVWQLQIQQAKAVLIANIIGYTLSAIAVYFFIKLLNKIDWGNWIEYPHKIIPMVVIGTIGVIYMAFNVFPTISESISIIINPEYWALKEIIKMVK